MRPQPKRPGTEPTSTLADLSFFLHEIYHIQMLVTPREFPSAFASMTCSSCGFLLVAVFLSAPPSLSLSSGRGVIWSYLYLNVSSGKVWQGRGGTISVPTVYREPQQCWGEEAGAESPVRGEAESVGGSPSAWCVRVNGGRFVWSLLCPLTGSSALEPVATGLEPGTGGEGCPRGTLIGCFSLQVTRDQWRT